MKLNQTGFSLVQTLVAIGLTGILAMIVMKNQETSTGMQQKNSANQIVSQTTQLVQKLVNDRASCTSSLTGKITGSNVEKLIHAQVNPADYNSFIPLGIMVEENRPMQNGVLVKKMTIVNDDGLDFLEINFKLDPDNKTKMMGGKEIKKRFQLQLSKASDGTIVTCHSESENLIQTSATESCKAMRGTMVLGKCEFMENLVDKTAKNCGGGASYRIQVVDGKIKLACNPCTVQKKFTRWNCEHKISGMKWLNVCYYKSGCSEDSSISYGYEFWEIGESSASSDGAGSEIICKGKRQRCSGE